MLTQVNVKPQKSIPGIQERPVIGSLSEYNKDRLAFLLRIARECGDIGLFHFGPYPVVLLNAPELIHSVLVEHADDYDKGIATQNAFQPIIGNGLFTSEGDFHRRQRKLLAPAFQPRHIVRYAEAMVRYGELIQQSWKDGTTIDAGHEMTQMTMSIVGKVLFDADVFTEADDLGAAMTTIFEHVNYVTSRLFPLPLSWPLPRHKRTKQARALLRTRIQVMIDERRQAGISGTERGDLLSILLQAREEDGAGMSNEQVCDEALTVFGAGHETTATALTWAWYLLATHPAIYSTMQEEVDSVLQGHLPTPADLPRLPYTLQVFKETMRLYPPAYALARAALHDLDLEGYSMRKTTTMLIAPYALHRRPDYYPDPERFDPNRFSVENERQLPRYAYMPFGAGPRICIGNHFAMMEGHLLLATLAQRVTFELLPGQRIEPAPIATLRPKTPIKMLVRRRNSDA